MKSNEDNLDEITFIAFYLRKLFILLNLKSVIYKLLRIYFPAFPDILPNIDALMLRLYL